MWHRDPPVRSACYACWIAAAARGRRLRHRIRGLSLHVGLPILAYSALFIIGNRRPRATAAALYVIARERALALVGIHNGGTRDLHAVKRRER